MPVACADKGVDLAERTGILFGLEGRNRNLEKCDHVATYRESFVDGDVSEDGAHEVATTSVSSEGFDGVSSIISRHGQSSKTNYPQPQRR
jgi:hypothetical protein